MTLRIRKRPLNIGEISKFCWSGIVVSDGKTWLEKGTLVKKKRISRTIA